MESKGAPARSVSGQRAHQRFAIGMQRLAQQLALRCLLDDAPGIHDGRGIASLRHHAEIGRDQDDGKAQPIAQIEQQSQDLRLHRHVQARGGLVGDQQLGGAGKGESDQHPLAYAAGELMGKPIILVARVGQPHLAQPFDRPFMGLAMADPVMKGDGFGDLCADGHDRIELRCGVLEHHRDLAPAIGAKIGFRQARNVAPGEIHPA